MSHPVAGFGVTRDAVGASQHRGRDNEIATQGIPVVQVRPLRAISREVSESAIRRLCGESVGQGTTRSTGRRSYPLFSARDFLGLADELLAIGGSAAHGIAPLPCQIGQATGQGLMAAKAARSQNVADILGK